MELIVNLFLGMSKLTFSVSCLDYYSAVWDHLKAFNTFENNWKSYSVPKLEVGEFLVLEGKVNLNAEVRYSVLELLAHSFYLPDSAKLFSTLHSRSLSIMILNGPSILTSSNAFDLDYSTA